MPTIISDISELQGVLDGIAADLEQCHFEADLSGVVPDIREMERGCFEGQHTPGGEPWRSLKPATVARKGHSTILYDKGRLKASLLSPGHGDGIVEAQRRSLIFGTAVPYGVFHQEGTGRIPQREFVGLNDKLVEKIADVIADSAVKQLTKL